MMRFNNYLEAISLSKAKYYTRMYNKDKYNDWFNNKNRIYIPLKTIENKPIKNKKIENLLSKEGYDIIDYQAGYAQPKTGSKNIIKIGKLLKRLFPEQPELIKMFESDPLRAGSKMEKKQMVVISRHPIDVAGMSTDRRWTSCMSLIDGCNKNKVKYDVRGGSIIAYLINADDKNIKNPISRILMKPYFIVNDNNEPIEDKTFLIPDKQYGIPNKLFSQTVMDWLNEKQGKLEGIFRIANKKIYTDSGKQQVVFLNKEAQELIRMYSKGKEDFKKIKEIINTAGFIPDRIQTGYGETLLSLVVRDWPIDIVEMLLKKGADPNVIDTINNTTLTDKILYNIDPWHRIVVAYDDKKFQEKQQNDAYQKIKLLIKYGLDINKKINNIPPLYRFARMMPFKLFKAFIEEFNADYKYKLFNTISLIDILKQEEPDKLTSQLPTKNTANIKNIHNIKEIELIKMVDRDLKINYLNELNKKGA